MYSGDEVHGDDVTSGPASDDDQAEDSIENINQAAMVGRLTDFLAYLDTNGYLAMYDAEGDQRPALASMVPGDEETAKGRWLEVATEYVTEAEEHEDQAPEWVTARNYGLRQE